jgi:hypothetical protein
VAYIPFRERLWCSPAEAGQVLGMGKTKVAERIRIGEIVSRKEGRLRRIHVPSLIARFGLESPQLEVAAMPDIQNKPTARVRRKNAAASVGCPQPTNEPERPLADARRKLP